MRNIRAVVNATVADGHGTVGLGGDAGVVCDKHDGFAALLELVEGFHDERSRGGVQVARRLVGQNDGWIVDKGARDGDALHLAARELGYAAAMKKTGVVHVFMHDAGAVDWKNPDDSKLIDATKAWFVYGSKVKAVMGPSLAPFATKEAAQAFQKANGGKLMSFADLTPEALGCGEKY